MAATKTKPTPKKKTKTKTKPASSPKSSTKSTSQKIKTKEEAFEAFKAALADLDKVPELRDTERDIQAEFEELSVPELQRFLRDNPTLRAVDNSRRTLPVEELDTDARKVRDQALKVVKECAEALAKVGEGIQGLDPVLDQKIRDARRVLIA